MKNFKDIVNSFDMITKVSMFDDNSVLVEGINNNENDIIKVSYEQSLVVNKVFFIGVK